MYEGMVVFTMHSGLGDWTLDVDVNGEIVTFPVNVLDSQTGTKYVGSYTGTDGEKYIVTLVKPFDWKVGMNAVSIVVHKEESVVSCRAVDNFTIEMDATMISMEHGSASNICAISVGNGYDGGRVDYTM